MDKDLKIIKKKYGEAMMHFCRENFSSLLETEELLSTLLLKHFYPSHILFEDIKKENLQGKFKNYIYSLIDVENNYEFIVNKTPEELMDEAGYVLTECTTESDIQEFRKYYEKNEELCTFWTNRLNSCRVFFAVKKDVDKIKRKDFKSPKRQDEYGTSVISIQFTKDGTNTVSIKNRYNHTVNNPDATFSNNLDNIIPGLTESFEKEYGIVQKYKNDNFEITNYVRANDGKYYKFNYEINNIYYCPNNIIIDNREVIKYEKEKYIVFDYFVLDLVNKKVSLYDGSMDESFQDTIRNIERIRIENKKECKDIYLTPDMGEDIVITLNKENKIIGYKNNNVETIGDYFLNYNKTITELSLPSVKTIGNDFLPNNEWLESIYVPKLTIINNYFLCANRTLKKLELPDVKEIGDCFLANNASIRELSLPKVEEVGDEFLRYNDTLTNISMPSVKKIGEYFLENNQLVKELSLPSVTTIKRGFLFWNENINRIDLPNVKKIENSFLPCAEHITDLSFPKLTKVGDNFLFFGFNLRNLSLPKIRSVGEKFLAENNLITILDLPKLEKTGKNFLSNNSVLVEINIPDNAAIDPGFKEKHLELFEKAKLKQKKLTSGGKL